jgi:hypothetical protein
MKPDKLNKSMKPLCLLVISALFVITAGAVPAGTAGAETGDAGLALSTGGVVASGGFSTPDGASFTVTFVYPTGTSVGTPATSGVDFTKPWASISEFVPGPTFGIPGLQSCSTLSNTTTHSPGYAIATQFNSGPANELARNGIYFDITCNDGRGYSYYRVRFDDQMFNGTPGPVFSASYTGNTQTYYWGTAVQSAGDHGVVLTYDAGIEVAAISICGFKAGFHCLKSSGAGGSIQPGPSLVLTTQG